MSCSKKIPFSFEKEGCSLTLVSECWNFKGKVASVQKTGDNSVRVTFDNGRVFDLYNYSHVGDLTDEEFVDCFMSIDFCTASIDVTKEDTEYLDRCRLSDEKDVVIKICTVSDGTVTLTDLDSGAVISEIDLVTLYAKECKEKQFICSELSFVLDEGESMDYDSILSLFNWTGTFDDGSVGAEGISYIQFANPLPSSYEYTYNGSTVVNGGNWGVGDLNSANPISQDVEITSLCSDTTINIVVYKCIQ